MGTFFGNAVYSQTDAPLSKKNKQMKALPEDLIEFTIKFLGIDTTTRSNPNKKIRFTLIPASSGTSNGKTTLISTLNASFTLGDPKRTNLSTANLSPSWSSGKFQLGLSSSIWLKNNSANIPGEFRYFNYNDYTWGLGGNTAESNRSNLYFKYVRFYQAYLKKIVGSWSGGIGYRYDGYSNISEELGDSTKPSNLSKYPYGTGSSSLAQGYTLQVLYDSRKNSNNPDQGKYLSIVYRNNPAWLRNDFLWQSVFIDGRIYVPLVSNKRKLLAFRSYYWSTLAGNVPYLDLPANGWGDLSSYPRGIERGRYRSNALLYGESEFRFDITKKGFLGGVAFVNCLSATVMNTGQFTKPNVAIGVGVRVKFNKISATNLGIDFAGNQFYQGVTVSLGEAF
jgi:hypothetical protein